MTTPFILQENEGNAPFMTNYSKKLLNPILPEGGGRGGVESTRSCIFGYDLFSMCGMILRSPHFDPLSKCIQNEKNFCSNSRTVSMVTDVLLCTL